MIEYASRDITESSCNLVHDSERSQNRVTKYEDHQLSHQTSYQLSVTVKEGARVQAQHNSFDSSDTERLSYTSADKNEP